MCQAGWPAPLSFSLTRGFLEHPHISGQRISGHRGYRINRIDEVPCPGILWLREDLNKLVSPDLRLDLGRYRKQVWEKMAREGPPEEVASSC